MNVVLLSFLAPGRALQKLTGLKRPMLRALFLMVVCGLAYALTSLLLGAAGAVPLAGVFLPVEVENYYFWQMIFALPAVLLMWVGAGLVLRLVAGGERASFRETLSRAGLAAGAPLFLAWLPSAVEAGLMTLGMGQEEYVGIVSPPGAWQTLYIAVYCLAALYLVVLMTAAAWKGGKSTRARRLSAGLAAALFAAAVFVLLIR
jgi:hypothetical protein